MAFDIIRFPVLMQLYILFRNAIMHNYLLSFGTPETSGLERLICISCIVQRPFILGVGGQGLCLQFVLQMQDIITGSSENLGLLSR